MIDTKKVRDFPSLYLEIAKLKPQDQKHLMMCLRNRQRVLKKEMELQRRQANGAPNQRICGGGDM